MDRPFNELVTAAKEADAPRFQETIDQMDACERREVLRQFAEQVNRHDNVDDGLPMIELVYSDKGYVTEMKANTKDESGTIWKEGWGAWANRLIVENNPVSETTRVGRDSLESALGHRSPGK